MPSYEHLKISLHPNTTVKDNIFPEYDESLVPEPIDDSTIWHTRELKIRNGFIEKTAHPGSNIYLEAVLAVLINHIAAEKSYYFKANKISLRGVTYSVSLVPEIPYLLHGSTII